MDIESHKVREKFIGFFTAQNHKEIPNASLIPENDPTLLVINSGMAPLKNYFTGAEKPPYPRLCNIQKCIRTNDIESVGDSHHLTFFEMMGNWSIGDYSKERAIVLAQTAISIYGFKWEKIYATVYSRDSKFPTIPSDTESEKIWARFLPPERIVKLGAEHNFWGPTGKTGPCGPCTEIFFDRGDKFGCGGKDCGPHCGCGRFIEVWNAGVFMQYYLHENGQITDLPLKSVDAGAGLERFCMILQNVNSVYETDIFLPIVKALDPEGTNNPSRSIRIMADHMRAASFMISDGIKPSNTKRGYILRRLIRRAFLHAILSKTDSDKLLNAVKVVIENSSYPTLMSGRQEILAVVNQEIATFEKGLKRGLKQYEKISKSASTTRVISSKDAFRLYDSYGIPIELTKDLAMAQGFTVDESGFAQLLNEQRERSRS